jgi:hypothetical protein
MWRPPYIISSLAGAFILILLLHCAAWAQVIVPLGGNTFTNVPEEKTPVTKAGVAAWQNSSDSFFTYVRVNRTGKLKIAVEVFAEQPATLAMRIGRQLRKINIDSTGLHWFNAGSFDVADTGYLKIILTGITKKGRFFPALRNYALTGEIVNGHTDYVKTDEGDFFYWGRRGPSVHLNYLLPDTVDARWFYNELTVPAGEDKVGSYFMANGFDMGYFGIQVNSTTERRILFSVWSPFDTNDPKTIPDSLKIRLLQKGPGVQTGEFGDEGSGAQSFMRFNWKAGITYRFAINAKPTGEDRTLFSAYFYLPEKKQWQLMASFERPKTKSTLRHLHSFLENFLPETGNSGRKVFFGNQWIADANLNWSALTKARFSADNTARKNYRMDYAGGVYQTSFYLQNCGFFKNYTQINLVFTRAEAGSLPPSILLLQQQFP